MDYVSLLNLSSCPARDKGWGPLNIFSWGSWHNVTLYQQRIPKRWERVLFPGSSGSKAKFLQSRGLPHVQPLQRIELLRHLAPNTPQGHQLTAATPPPPNPGWPCSGAPLVGNYCEVFSSTLDGVCQQVKGKKSWNWHSVKFTETQYKKDLGSPKLFLILLSFQLFSLDEVVRKQRFPKGDVFPCSSPYNQLSLIHISSKKY